MKTEAADPGSSPREVRQRARQNLAMEQLLDVAEELFGDLGYDRTTLRATAQAAEMSIGAVYQSFAGKKDLYRAVFARRIETYQTGLAEAVTSGPTAVGRLQALVAYNMSFYHQHPIFGRLILRHVGATLFAGMDFVDPELSIGYEHSESSVRSSIIEHGQATGEFRSGDPQTLMRLFSAVMLAHLSTDPLIVGEVAATTPMTGDELADLLTRLLKA